MAVVVEHEAVAAAVACRSSFVYATRLVDFWRRRLVSIDFRAAKWNAAAGWRATPSLHCSLCLSLLFGRSCGASW